MDIDSGFKQMEHIESTPSETSNVEMFQLALKLMDKYQKAFEALTESEPTSDLPDSSPDRPE